MKQAAQARTGPLTAEVKARLAQLPSSRSEIEDAISRKDEEIHQIHVSNPGAMDEYNARRASIEKTRRALEDQRDNIQVKTAMVEESKVSSPAIRPFAPSC